MLPGWCEDRTGLRPLAERLAQHRRVLSLDWRGHGESGAASGEFGMQALLDDALAVLDASGARSIVPVTVAHAG